MSSLTDELEDPRDELRCSPNGKGHTDDHVGLCNVPRLDIDEREKEGGRRERKETKRSRVGSGSLVDWETGLRRIHPVVCWGVSANREEKDMDKPRAAGMDRSRRAPRSERWRDEWEVDQEGVREGECGR